MKVIHLVLGKANPDRMNGVNKVVHSLATQQSKAGSEVEVWGITPSHNEPVKDRAYKVRLFQSHWNKWQIDAMLKKAIMSLKHGTIVHFHAGFIPEFYPISRCLYQRQIPYVITPHGNYMQGAMRKNAFLKRWYFKIREQAILQNAFFVHCIGRGEIEDLNQMGISANIKLIPNGQDLDSFNFRQQTLPKPKTPVFGFCGRLTRQQKGLDLLLEGFRSYKEEENGSGVLWLVGDGEYKEPIMDFIQKHHFEQDIKLFGSRFGEEKLNILNNMDAFYHPSRNEGLPMAVLEAAVLGKPLVVSAFTNMTEYVATYQAGICLQDNTPAHIAKSMELIQDMFCSGELHSLGKNARRMAEENFDWKQIAIKMLDAYATSASLAIA